MARPNHWVESLSCPDFTAELESDLLELLRYRDIPLWPRRSTRSNEDTKTFHFLIWDANTEQSEQLHKMLLKLGFTHIDCADSYESGLKAMEAQHYTFIFLARGIPGVEAGSLVRALRDTIEYRETPILVISSSTEVEDLLEIMKSGANDRLLHPVDIFRLHHQIKLHGTPYRLGLIDTAGLFPHSQGGKGAEAQE